MSFFGALGFIFGAVWIGGLDWRSRSTGCGGLKNILSHVFFLF